MLINICSIQSCFEIRLEEASDLLNYLTASREIKRVNEENKSLLLYLPFISQWEDKLFQKFIHEVYREKGLF